MLTAQAILHFFFDQASFLSPTSTSAGLLKPAMSSSLFLATKLEQTPRKLRDLLSVFHYVWCIAESRIGWKKRNEIPVIDRNSRQFELLLNDTITLQRDILAFLGYGLHRVWGQAAVSPLSCLPSLVQNLLPSTESSNRRLLNKAVGFINDSARVSLVGSYPPTAIAGASLFLSSRICDIALPDCEWWLLCGIISLNSLEKIAGRILDVSRNFQNYDIKVDEIFELGNIAGVVLWNQGPQDYYHKGLDYLKQLPITKQIEQEEAKPLENGKEEQKKIQQTNGTNQLKKTNQEKQANKKKQQQQQEKKIQKEGGTSSKKDTRRYSRERQKDNRRKDYREREDIYDSRRIRNKDEKYQRDYRRGDRRDRDYHRDRERDRQRDKYRNSRYKRRSPSYGHRSSDQSDASCDSYRRYYYGRSLKDFEKYESKEKKSKRKEERQDRSRY